MIITKRENRLANLQKRNIHSHNGDLIAITPLFLKKILSMMISTHQIFIFKIIKLSEYFFLRYSFILKKWQASLILLKNLKINILLFPATKK